MTQIAGAIVDDDDFEIHLPVRYGVGMGVSKFLSDWAKEELLQKQMEGWGDHAVLFDSIYPDMTVYVVIAPTLYGFIDNGLNRRLNHVDHEAKEDTLDWKIGGVPDWKIGKDVKFFLMSFENVCTEHDQVLDSSNEKIVEEYPSHYVATRRARTLNDEAEAEVCKTLSLAELRILHAAWIIEHWG